ncbi:TVP38/TMEM64 family protein [Halanaerobacter jeridensis]|uniref:TVP38/TMEM64 family membrane protein n=1 Tax=Halanaerobacter jeridensis TaxID=706427 RepID=A0A938XW83_9FIRM|nr:TVP38/TMEM64 family protein [Halanaerobacter jeridensis]MBM7556410.1 putative membrane protein YdjX (TVP38/TMEM64 family) [Halanaerobacter jeridensis]
MSKESSGSNNWIKIVAFIAIIVAVFFVVKQMGYMKYLKDPQMLKQAIDGLGFWGPVVFIGLWIASAVFLLPGGALGLVGGVLFGPWLGTTYTIFGATLGAVAAFLAGKYVARDMVKSMVENNPKLQKIDKGVEEEGWRFLMLTRLVPVFPYNVQNYVYALTAVDLLTYTWTTFVFMLPGSLAFSFAGGAVTSGGSPVKIIAYLAVAGLVLFGISLIPKWLKKKSDADVLDEIEEAEE